MTNFTTVRGMRDFLPVEAKNMRHVEQTARNLAQLYGYNEVITPIVESLELLTAKSGEEIRKRMYRFEDLSGRKVGLRPEFTASIARLVATKMMSKPKPIRLFCVGSLYRYDEPQFGRFREFWQANYEIIGSSRAEADAEILILTHDLLSRLGLQNCHFKVGHIGILRGILNHERFDEETQNRIMQLLDKNERTQAISVVRDVGATPKCVTTLKNIFQIKGKDRDRTFKRAKEKVEDYSEAIAALENLEDVVELTESLDRKLKMTIEVGFARGLEYYTGMIFEPYIPEVAIALSGGGRYDRLIELFGGESMPAVGVAQGVDRIVLAMENQKTTGKRKKGQRVEVIPVSGDCKGKMMEIAALLRTAGITAEVEVMGRTVSNALADANRRGTTHAVIVGPKELQEGKIVLRDMIKRAQRPVKIADLCEAILESSQ